MSEFYTTSNRPNEAPMPDPLAYFITVTTYGTWLPGDERGWILKGKGFQPPQPLRQKDAANRMTETECWLTEEQRSIVEQTIKRHCEVRGWELFEVNCRSNHFHVVVAADIEPETVRDQFKAWCTRKLKEHQRTTQPGGEVREKWWTAKGSSRYIGDEYSLEQVIIYVRDAQDRKDRDE